MTKSYILRLVFFYLTSLFCISCNDDLDLVIDYPTNITFEKLPITGRFVHMIPDNGFSINGLNFNTVKSSDGQLSGGFCYSNRSMRSFVWSNSTEAMDSIRYSVYTNKPNDTGIYLVCHVSDNNAYFTLDKAQVIDYILVGNTTWDYLAMTYGDTFGSESSPAVNPNVPSKPRGVWHTYVEGGVKKFSSKDYFTLTATGYRDGAETGHVDFDLACMRGHNTEKPSWNYIVSDWWKMSLAELGEVDKVVFSIDSSDKNEQGIIRTPAWFCLDGLQLKKN